MLTNNAAANDDVFPTTPSTSSPSSSNIFKYCVALYNNAHIPPSSNPLRKVVCFRDDAVTGTGGLAQLEAYINAVSVSNGGIWRNLGRMWVLPNRNTSNGVLHIMGRDGFPCSTRDYQERDMQVAVAAKGGNIAYFSDNIRSAEQIGAMCDDIRLWDGPDYTGNSITCNTYCADIPTTLLTPRSFKIRS